MENKDKLAKTFHRRDLPSPAIPFSSKDGKDAFKEAMLQGFLEMYFPLAENFVTQSDPAFCGLGSLTMSLNALLIDPKRVWKGE